MHDKPRVLFLCTGNSCRSQMAEGWARALHGDSLLSCSAGIEAHGLDPRAVVVMAEVGIDISGQVSKRFADLAETRYALVVTVCGHADETCPVLPDVTRHLHIPFDDPPRLAATAATDAEALAHYRRVRDEIGTSVADLPRRMAALRATP